MMNSALGVPYDAIRLQGPGLGFNGHQARVSIKPGRVSRYQEEGGAAKFDTEADFRGIDLLTRHQMWLRMRSP